MEMGFSTKCLMNTSQEIHSQIFWLNEDNRVFITNVIFEPGCRNNWHIYHAKTGGSQASVLQVTDGIRRDMGTLELKHGRVVEINPNVKHWHGAQKDSWFSYLSVEIPGEETSNEWLEVVDDEHYNNL